MRSAYSNQMRLDIEPVVNVELNLGCRDAIIPVLAGLQYIYSKPEVRDEILRLVANDLNADSRRDIGRRGFSDWETLVLAGVRLGCNFDYDQLQDLAENHRALRGVMGIGEWDERTSFGWRRIQRTLSLIKPTTLDAISQLVVAEGHILEPDAVKKHRVDSFVVETNIHFPTESSLIFDGLVKVIGIASELAAAFDIAGWRQHVKLVKSVKNIHLNVSRISRGKSAKAEARMKKEYQRLLKKSKKILRRSDTLLEEIKERRKVSVKELLMIDNLKHFIGLTQQVCGTAWRRVVNGEDVPNEDKLFSIFEPHTQLYRRGKAGEPNQFGRLLLVYEDSAGFITHHHLMSRTDQDVDVAVEQTRILQERLNKLVEEISFDRGFDGASLEELLKIVARVCLPKKHPKAFAAQLKEASDNFKESRKRHSGVESAIGALQSGNGLKRSRDRGEIGFEKYIGLAILGRNIHTLGKLLIRAKDSESEAAFTKRQAA